MAVCELPRPRDSPSSRRACEEGQVRRFRLGWNCVYWRVFFFRYFEDRMLENDGKSNSCHEGRLSSCRYHHVGTPVLLLKRNMILAPSVIEYFGFHVAFGSVVDINRHKMIAFVVFFPFLFLFYFAVYLFGMSIYIFLPHRNSQCTSVADAYRTFVQVPPESLARSRVARLYS